LKTRPKATLPASRALIKIEGDYALVCCAQLKLVCTCFQVQSLTRLVDASHLPASVFVRTLRSTTHRDQHQPFHVRTDTYRASGAGGQHNKTDSAVRPPTSLPVSWCSARTVAANTATATWPETPVPKLYDFELRKQQEEQQKLEDTKTDVGHQIRSQARVDNTASKTCAPTSRFPPHRKVLDGDLDPFIEASPARRLNMSFTA
jgi:peptide chain release factor 2